MSGVYEVERNEHNDLVRQQMPIEGREYLQAQLSQALAETSGVTLTV